MSNMNVSMDNYGGTITRDYKGLYYFSVFDLEHSLNNWVLDTTIVKSTEQKDMFVKFRGFIPKKTNYYIMTGIDLLLFCTTGEFWRYSVINRPFGSSKTEIRVHLAHFQANREGCGSHHKIVLSKAQYDILAFILTTQEQESDTWTSVGEIDPDTANY